MRRRPSRLGVGRANGSGHDSRTRPLVEECFQRAIALARLQQARLWELRAVLGLSRAWQSWGWRTEARQLLEDSKGIKNENLEKPGKRGVLLKK